MDKIAIGSDRRGFSYKTRLITYLKSKGYEVVDVGPYDADFPVDYPIYGERVGRLVAALECKFGVVICATGIGIMIAANKVDGVRCGIAYTDEVAKLMREHNDANVIAFGESQMAYDDVQRRLDIFLNSVYASGYHDYRVEQLKRIECNAELSQSPLFNSDGK